MICETQTISINQRFFAWAGARVNGMDREAIGATVASLNMLLLIKSPKELPHVKMNGVMLRHRLLKVHISQI